MALIRLHTCTDWSEPLLVAHTTLLQISCHSSFIKWFDLFSDGPTGGTRGGVDQYEAMEVDEEGGPGPQRCEFEVQLSINTG